MYGEDGGWAKLANLRTERDKAGVPDFWPTVQSNH